MSHEQIKPAVDADGMPTDPLYAHVMGGQIGICYLLTMAGCGILLGRYGFPLIIWILTLPLSAYVCLMQARRLGGSRWLAVLCAPFPPFSLWLFNRLAGRLARRSTPLPIPEQLRPDDTGGRAA